MENQKVDKIEVKKDLYKSKAIAKLMYYNPNNGDLMYSVQALGKTYEFPIHTIQNTTIKHKFSKFEEKAFVDIEIGTIKLNDELKGAQWPPEIKGSDLNRWIGQAIDAGEFVLAMIPENFSN
jgi:hypothetical protein